MKRKLTPPDFALWAALPMAHPSKIERRMTRILDKNRPRTLPRRTLQTVFALSAAALVPLAMLRPTVKAQTVFQSARATVGTGAVELIGVKDIDIHHTDHRWWKPNGLLSPNAVPDIATPPTLKGSFCSSNEKNLCFVFRLPAIVDGQGVTFEPSGSLASTEIAASWSGEVNTQQPHRSAERNGDNGSGWTLYASFPGSAKATTINVGIATGPWIAVASHASARDTASRVTNRHGTFLFHPIIRLPVPDKTWSVTVTMSNSKQDCRIVGVDKQGNVILPSYSGSTVTGRLLHLSPVFPHSVSIAQIKGFRVETRPFTWTEFKSVALQPSSPPVPAMEGPDAAAIRLHRIYGFIQTYRKRYGGAFPQFNSDDLTSDMTANPAAYGLPKLGRPDNYTQAMHFFTSPDSQFAEGGFPGSENSLIVYVIHGKRPDGALVGTAKRRGTRDVLASTNLYVHDHPDGATGFYLVLWDDGTVEKILATKALLVPNYDSSDPAIMNNAAARRYWKQVAFPGQAGLP